jgi:hypothetical protein
MDKVLTVNVSSIAKKKIVFFSRFCFVLNKRKVDKKNKHIMELPAQEHNIQ